jgi:hypothetical protein
VRWEADLSGGSLGVSSSGCGLRLGAAGSPGVEDGQGLGLPGQQVPSSARSELHQTAKLLGATGWG